MLNSSPKELKHFIKNKVIKDSKKVRGKHSPIAEIVEGTLYSLPVKFLYDLREKLKYLFLIGVKNYSKQPKVRYFLTVSLANNSSDLLVQLAKDYAVKNDLNLVQYSIFLKTLRIQLLALKEIKNIDDYNNSLDILHEFRKIFRDKLVRIKRTIENE
ncbi:MAG: hypothetical protein ACXABO_12005 [Promethearchaeota archaeon]|jgi:hypothetical protein